jgi:hypothetical protein
MIANLLMLVPGAGPFLAAGWRLLSTPAGRRVVVFTAGIAASFGCGWSLKARLDRSATLQAVIAKQRIDLRAARDTANAANAIAADIATRDANNQEIIRDLQRDLQLKLAQRPAGACVLDDASARGLRRLR